MTLGANQIGAYAADLLDLEDQLGALQDAKRDLYAAIREEHGKGEAASLKLAVKLSRMDEGKRADAEAVDAEAQRMLAIIAKSRAPRATRAIARDVPISEPAHSEPSGVAADQGEGASAPGSLADQSQTGGQTLDQGGEELAAVESLPATPTAADNARKIRPWCLHADDLGKCGGYGHKHCDSCLKAHADAENISA